jgi:hypothetical protein
MPRTDRWPKRIGAVFLPVADTVDLAEDVARRAEPTLRQGCYTVRLRWAAAHANAPGQVGTLRVEPVLPRVRFSGDLYREQLPAEVLAGPHGGMGPRPHSGEAADAGGGIPIYPRSHYRSYLRGVGVDVSSAAPGDANDKVVLKFKEFVYTHQPGDFRGRFRQKSARTVRFVLAPTGSPGHYRGTAHASTGAHGTVSIRWISPHYRRADLQLHTLEGAVAPPAEVEGVSFATIFADAGWELSATDGGTFPLPAALAQVDVNSCWAHSDMRTLLTLVPGFDLSELDSVWRVHLVAIPAKLGCSRGWMPEFIYVGDSEFARVGALTYSHDGYPSARASTGPHDEPGSSQYDLAADRLQYQVPRAYLRSAAHELGHAFNQIHQEKESPTFEPDNSIMTTTPGVAAALGEAGTFPDQINLAFNDRVKTHLRHMPDPAVRPGAMSTMLTVDAIAHIPQAADVHWPEQLELTVQLSTDRVTLGEPATLSWTLTNHGPTAVAAPTELAAESLAARVSVTDPTGRITFMRPAEVRSYPPVPMAPLEPGASVRGSTTLFWGQDGFAFRLPGRHLVEVIALWRLAGVPIAVSGDREVWVTYPTSNEDNEVAALLLDPDVGKAVAFGDLAQLERASHRIGQAQQLAPNHPASQAFRRLGLSEQPA